MTHEQISDDGVWVPKDRWKCRHSRLVKVLQRAEEEMKEEMPVLEIGLLDVSGSTMTAR